MPIKDVNQKLYDYITSFYYTLNQNCFIFYLSHQNLGINETSENVSKLFLKPKLRVTSYYFDYFAKQGYLRKFKFLELINSAHFF